MICYRLQIQPAYRVITDALVVHSSWDLEVLVSSTLYLFSYKLFYKLRLKKFIIFVFGELTHFVSANISIN